MLTSFSVENYRSFADETTIELRPLTLLFGYNNAGKSALIRALALIADSAKSDASTPLNLDSDAARECTFDELCSKITGSTTMKFGLNFYDGMLRADYRIKQPTITDPQVIEELTITNRRHDQSALSLTYSWQPEGRYQLHYAQQLVDSGRLVFNGLVPDSVSDWSVPSNTHGMHVAFTMLQGALSKLRRDLQWIGSVRSYPQRFVSYKGGVPKRIGSNGARVVEFLVQDKLANGSLLTRVSQWYETSFKRKLDVKQSPDGRVSLTLEPLTIVGDRSVNLADTGEGIAQVLPVLVAAAMAHRGGPTDPTILAIEQPELHLHPAVHDKLAKYLCDIADTKRPRMLIETHSENFLLGVQIQIVKREIPAEDVLIYWVSQDDDGASHVHRITFDQEGYPQGFPESVFHEDLELARMLLDLRERAGA